MQFVILGLLLMAPLSLYDVHKHFEQGISLFYRASFGSIQRALTQLVRDGLVTVSSVSDSRRGRKLHAITDAGRDAWRRWMLEPVTGSDAETAVLAKVFLLGSLPKDERGAVVATLRARVAADLAQLRAFAVALDASDVPEEYAAVDRYRRATLDYGIRSHELGLTWLDGLP